MRIIQSVLFCALFLIVCEQSQSTNMDYSLNIAIILMIAWVASVLVEGYRTITLTMRKRLQLAIDGTFQAYVLCRSESKRAKMRLEIAEAFARLRAGVLEDIHVDGIEDESALLHVAKAALDSPRASPGSPAQ